VTFQLRRADSADLSGIMAIESAVFGTDAWSAGMMRAELESRHSYYLVAFRPETPDLIEAYAGLLSPQRSGEAEIQTIAVAASARRRGLGRTLMHQLTAEARRRGAHEMFLEVRADNPGAQELYASLGFEQIAVRPRYYQPDDVDAIVMRLTIPEPRLSPAIGATR